MWPRHRFHRALFACSPPSWLLPWSGLVSRADFSRVGAGGLAPLEYGQSTLFVEWLAERHGAGALTEFLLAIGGGATPTQAFEATLGPFAPQAEAFGAAASELVAEYGPGLHQLSLRAPGGARRSLAVVVGAAAFAVPRLHPFPSTARGPQGETDRGEGFPPFMGFMGEGLGWGPRRGDSSPRRSGPGP
ncbi:MAG TPA: hypothetical protein VEQ11_12320 [Chloroflexota bacterium]|nr:hypothetical protein [Chloroflexota bacterium]